MTDKVLAAYRAWMKAANPTWTTVSRASNVADENRRQARVVRLKERYETLLRQSKTNPVGSYRGHTVHSTAGVHKLFGPAGPTLFTGVGAMGKLRSHVDALPAKRNPKNPQRRVWRVSFSHVDGPLGEKWLRAIVSRWSGQLRVSGGDHIATFAAQDDANAAVRQAGSAGFGGQVREGIIQRKNTGQTTTRPKRNHHLAVGTPVLSAGHIARITKQLPKDYYTIKYVDTGSLRTVRGSTLNKK